MSIVSHVTNFMAGGLGDNAHVCSQAAIVSPKSSSTIRSNTVVLAEEQGELCGVVEEM